MDAVDELQFALVRQGPGMKNKVVYLSGENAVGKKIRKTLKIYFQLELLNLIELFPIID